MTVLDLISLLLLLYFLDYDSMCVHKCMYIYIYIYVMFIPVQQLLNNRFILRSTVGVTSQVVSRMLILNLIYLKSSALIKNKTKYGLYSLAI